MKGLNVTIDKKYTCSGVVQVPEADIPGVVAHIGVDVAEVYACADAYVLAHIAGRKL
jgi:hypothetical protein